MANNTSSQQKRSPIARFFIGLIKFVFLIIIIGAGGVLGWLGWQQLTVNAQATEILSNRISNLSAGSIGEGDVQLIVLEETAELRSSMNSLSTALDMAERENGALQDTVTGLEATIAEQAVLLAELQSSQTALAERIASNEEGTQTIGSAAQALQNDLSTLQQDIDSVGANVDGLTSGLAAVEESITALESITTTAVVADEAVEEPVAADSQDDGASEAPQEISIDVALLRAMSLVMRTKLHIIEDDIEAAASSLALAQVSVEEVIAKDDGSKADSLASAQAALETAVADLENKPALANLSLDEALDSLDTALNGVSLP